MIRLTIFLVAVSLMLAQLSTAEIDQNTIVGAWLFDEANGKVAADSSDNGYDGNLVGGAKWVKGKFGNAIELNGKDAWVTVPAIAPLKEFTLLKWFNSTGRVGAWRCFFNRDGWAAGYVHYQFRPDNKMEMAIHSNNPVRHPGWQQSDFTADQSISNKWFHLAVAYSSTDESVRVYFDGKLDAEGKWGPLPGEFGPGRIGSWSGGGREWQGMLDEMLLFNVSLEEDDIKMLMENGLEGALAVEAADKAATIWGKIKVGYTEKDKRETK
ncbi:MAG: LamG domain-containing protein [Candidatus Poribacteria bacterium]|nr:LamG domain-containing protein [Candidatus Poribacteria bacterium]